jgi:hypothetical protein
MIWGWLLISSTIGYGYFAHNDYEAYSYCMHNTSSFIAVVWPLAQGKDKKMESVLRSYGTMVYKKVFSLTYQQAYALLQDAHPHIIDMPAHVQMYFPEGVLNKPVRVYLLEFDSLETAVACKHAVRKLFKLGYTSIHINDYHHEAQALAKFFFNGEPLRRSALRNTSVQSRRLSPVEWLLEGLYAMYD